MDITQARAVVTGGASGLGNAVAKHIAARGGQVATLRVHPSLPGVASGAGDAPRPPEAAPLDARTV